MTNQRSPVAGRGGFGLLELLIALTLTSAVALLVWTMLSRAAGRLRDRSERMGMEHTLRVASAVARATIESLGSDSTGGTDLATMNPDGLIARAVRGSGVLCAASPVLLTVRDGPDWWTAVRAPVAGRDSLLIGTTVEPARWIAANLPAAPGTGACADGSPALTLPVALAPADLAAIGVGSPIRFFEPLELRSYSSALVTWLGVRSTTSAGTIQPLSGPFQGAGITFGFFTTAGFPAGGPGSVRLITIRSPAVTERGAGVGMARLSQPQSDSAAQTVALRNVP